MANTMTEGYGLFEGRHLRGVLVFQTPCCENVRASVFGPDDRDRVTELHRLVLVDDTPRNTESYFIASACACLKRARPGLHAVLTFADPSAGHLGIIYQASNAAYSGLTKPRRARYGDPDGRLRHRRQCGGTSRGRGPGPGLDGRARSRQT